MFTDSATNYKLKSEERYSVFEVKYLTFVYILTVTSGEK